MLRALNEVMDKVKRGNLKGRERGRAREKEREKEREKWREGGETAIDKQKWINREREEG